jgi:hypothetical protein
MGVLHVGEFPVQGVHVGEFPVQGVHVGEFPLHGAVVVVEVQSLDVELVQPGQLQLELEVNHLWEEGWRLKLSKKGEANAYKFTGSTALLLLPPESQLQLLLDVNHLSNERI